MARKKEKNEDECKTLVITGKRKTAISKVMLCPGNGKIIINNKPVDELNLLQKLSITEPLEIASKVLGEKIKQIDFNISISGSGRESQIEAARLAIARALIAFTKSSELRNLFLRYDRTLLIADIRRKEQRKPNDSKARAARQKSYR